MLIRLLPFHWTVELEMKLLPFTVRLKAAPPALTDVGESEEIDGTGLLGGGGGADPFPPPHEAAQKTDTRRTKACSRRVAMCLQGPSVLGSTKTKIEHLGTRENSFS